MNTIQAITFSLFAFTFSAFFESAIAGPLIPVIRRLPDNPNPIQGVCKDLRAAAANGVKDSAGHTYVGACGYTQFVPYFDGLELQTYVEEVANKNINPLQITFYQDTSGMKCARANGFNVELSGSVEVSYLNWLHNKPANSRCANEWDRLKKVIVDHEAKHVADAQPVLTTAQRRLDAVAISYCTASGDPTNGLIEKGLIEFRDTAIALKKDWEKLSAAHDKEGDLCNINCCSCSDTACYSGSFNAKSSSPASISFAEAKGQNIEMVLDREDKDSNGRVIQQFYIIERGQFVYPAMVAMGEFDCILDKTIFPLTSSRADMTLYLNNPNFPKNSYNLGFSTEGYPTGDCHLRSDPNVKISIPLSPFTFGLLKDCSSLQTKPIKNPNFLEGSFPNACAGTTTTVDWIFKLNN